MTKLVSYAILAVFAVSMYVSGIFTKKNFYTIEAQTLPYTITIGWDASVDAVDYNCYLDNVKQNTVTGLTCSFPIPTLGAHVVGVTAHNDTYVPSESAQATLNITLKQPAKPGNVKVK